MPCEGIEVAVAVQYGQVGADGQRADEAVHENANGFAAAAALSIERCRLIEVAGLHRNEHGAGNEPPKVATVLFVPGASQQLHTNRVARREVGPEQLPDPDARRRSGVAQVLDPGGRVNEDHRGVRASRRGRRPNPTPASVGPPRG